MNIDVKYEQLLAFITGTDEFIYKLIATGSQGITGKLKMEVINCSDQYYLLATTKANKSIIMKINSKDSFMDTKAAIFPIEVKTDGLVISLTMEFLKNTNGTIKYSHSIKSITAIKISMKAAIPIINVAINTVLNKATTRINKKVEWVIVNSKLNGEIRCVSDKKLNDINKAGVLDFVKELS